MKKLSFLALILAAFIFLAPRAQAEDNITFQVFYDALSPYGDWIYVDGYGYCWHPAVAEDWAPYTNGNWAYTDAGWTWCGDEEWSWIPYHYGRWIPLEGWGWVWVPGYEWAPAWVSWRYSDDYIGWAPLPPVAVWNINIGFTTNVDVEYNIGPSYYNFCPIQSFSAPQLKPCLRPSWDNAAIFPRTRNVTRISRGNNNAFICNNGPDLAEVNRRVQKPFREIRLQRQQNVNPSRLAAGHGRNQRQDSTLQVVAPPVAKAESRPRRISAEIIRPPSVRPSDAVPTKHPRHRTDSDVPVSPLPVPSTTPPAPANVEPEAAPSQSPERPNQGIRNDRPNRQPRPVRTPNHVPTGAPGVTPPSTQPSQNHPQESSGNNAIPVPINTPTSARPFVPPGRNRPGPQNQQKINPQTPLPQPSQPTSEQAAQREARQAAQQQAQQAQREAQQATQRQVHQAQREAQQAAQHQAHQAQREARQAAQREAQQAQREARQTVQREAQQAQRGAQQAAQREAQQAQREAQQTAQREAKQAQREARQAARQPGH